MLSRPSPKFRFKFVIKTILEIIRWEYRRSRYATMNFERWGLEHEGDVITIPSPKSLCPHKETEKWNS